MEKRYSPTCYSFPPFSNINCSWKVYKLIISNNGTTENRPAIGLSISRRKIEFSTTGPLFSRQSPVLQVHCPAGSHQYHRSAVQLAVTSTTGPLSSRQSPVPQVRSHGRTSDFSIVARCYPWIWGLWVPWLPHCSYSRGTYVNACALFQSLLCATGSLAPWKEVALQAEVNLSH